MSDSPEEDDPLQQLAHAVRKVEEDSIVGSIHRQVHPKVGVAGVIAAILSGLIIFVLGGILSFGVQALLPQRLQELHWRQELLCISFDAPLVVAVGATLLGSIAFYSTLRYYRRMAARRAAAGK